MEARQSLHPWRSRRRRSLCFPWVCSSHQGCSKPLTAQELALSLCEGVVTRLGETGGTNSMPCRPGHILEDIAVLIKAPTLESPCGLLSHPNPGGGFLTNHVVACRTSVCELDVPCGVTSGDLRALAESACRGALVARWGGLESFEDLQGLRNMLHSDSTVHRDLSDAVSRPQVAHY